MCWRHTGKKSGICIKSQGLLLQDWIIKMSDIKDLIAFKKMKQLGFTGDVMQDMKKMEEAR